MKGSRILLIDDDQQLGTLLKALFGFKGHIVDLALDGEEGISVALGGSYDLVVLDVMLPKKNGFEVLRELRRSSNMPVMMLTAKGEGSDRIAGLEYGADDYLSKPFDPEELLLRVQVILRREAGRKLTEADTLVVGPLVLRIRQLEASVGDRMINLTATEVRVLEELMRSPGRVQSREVLTKRALGRARVAFDRAVDTHISHLRKKLGRDSLNRPVIRCVRGTGYLLVPEWQPRKP